MRNLQQQHKAAATDIKFSSLGNVRNLQRFTVPWRREDQFSSLGNVRNLQRFTVPWRREDQFSSLGNVRNLQRSRLSVTTDRGYRSENESAKNAGHNLGNDGKPRRCPSWTSSRPGSTDNPYRRRHCWAKPLPTHQGSGRQLESGHPRYGKSAEIRATSGSIISAYFRPNRRSHSDSVKPTRDSSLARSSTARWACVIFSWSTQRYRVPDVSSKNGLFSFAGSSVKI